jgi:hypothetical protein
VWKAIFTVGETLNWGMDKSSEIAKGETHMRLRLGSFKITQTVILVLALGLAESLAQAPKCQPFEMIWRADSRVVADMSFLLDAPAGKKGFIQVKNGHLATPEGRRFRIWGVNLSFVASLPDKENAPHYAAHLARFGVNCVRIHHLDWRAPRGIIDSRYPDSRHLDPEKLDRLDFFINELKQRGIYVNLNLNVAHAFQEGDGVKDAGKLGFAKALTLFDSRMIELEKEYGKHLLGHVNPYTKTEYRNEPAVALVELVNENSIVESWVSGRLRGRGPASDQADSTWTDIPESYGRDLDTLWAKAGHADPRLQPEEFQSASSQRFQAEAAFYMELERKFFLEMQDYLKRDLGVKAPIVGTSVHNGGMSGYPLLTSTSQLDVVDAHVYWQHPRYFADSLTGKRGFEIRNTPMVNQPEQSTVVTLNRSAFAGKPFTVSEVNHPYPNEFGAEGLPILAAYGAFQDWDGVFWYSFSHEEPANWVSKYPGHFDIRQDPVKMTQLAACAAMFLRSDVSTAKKVLNRSYSSEQVLESLRLPKNEAPNFTPGMPSTLALHYGSRVASLDGKPTETFPPISGPIVTDTSELRWELNKDRQGLVTVETSRAQALIGFLKSTPTSLRHLRADVRNEFCAILLISMDGKPLSQSGTLLLSTGARTGNTGMKWDEKHTTLVETGTGPILIEPVTGTITLLSIAGAKRIEVLPLDGAGRRLGSAVVASKSSTGWQFPIGQSVTPWYLINVIR